MNTNRSLAVLFPGSGVHYRGMGKRIYEENKIARHVFEEASDELNIPIKKWCFESDIHSISQMHLAIFVSSIAGYEVFRDQYKCDPYYVAGHSLGEFTAITAAGVLSFRDALRIVNARARIIESCTPENHGVLVVAKLSSVKLIQIVAEFNVTHKNCFISCYNTASQHTVSGGLSDIRLLEKICRQAGAVCQILNIPFPTHSPLLGNATKEFKVVLSSYKFNGQAITVLSNITGKPYPSDVDWSDALTDQLIKPVRWKSIVDYLILAQIKCYVDVGPRAILKQMAHSDDKTIPIFAFEHEGDRVLLKEIFPETQLTRSLFFSKLLTVAVATQNYNEQYEHVFDRSLMLYKQLEDLYMNDRVMSAETEAIGIRTLEEILDLKKVPSVERLRYSLGNILKRKEHI